MTGVSRPNNESPAAVGAEHSLIERLRALDGNAWANLYDQHRERIWRYAAARTGMRDTADDINRALSSANASLYALCSAVICSLGYVPSLGFVHDAGTLPFVYDVADIYKHLTSIPAAFLAVRQDPKDDGALARKLLKRCVEEERLLQRMPKDLAALFETGEAAPVQAGARPSCGGSLAWILSLAWRNRVRRC